MIHQTRIVPLLLLIGVLTLGLTACGDEPNRDYGNTDFPQMFTNQLEASCAPEIEYWKEVKAASEEKKKVKVITCGKKGTASIDGKSLSFSLAEDLSYAFKYFYRDPFLKDYFDEENTQDLSFHASLKQENWDDSQLKSQTIEVNPDDPTKLLYAESEVEAKSIFYHQKVVTKVFFNQDGSFQYADVYLYNKLKLTGKDLTTLILIYPATSSDAS